MKIYDSFYHAPKPEGIELRKAYIVGGGIAGLSAAAFLIDDAGMPGQNITIYEKRRDTGGCCGVVGTQGAYVCPGEREMMTDMECLWYLCSKIPSLDTPGRTVLDETVDSNLDNPIHSECRCIKDRGHIWEGIHDFRLDPDTTKKLAEFMMEPEENLEDVTIEEYFGKDSPFLSSAFWWCFHTMLAFKPYHSALEAQRYLNRFSAGNRVDYLEGILHTKRNEYDSIIKPLTAWLEQKGVNIVYGCSVYDLDMDAACNTVEGILARQGGEEVRIPVRPEDYVFVTCGSMMTNARFGDNTHIAETCRDMENMGLFTIWKNLAAKDQKFGHPEKFLNYIDKSKFMTFFLTVKDYPEFFERLERKTGSRPGTGGCITVMDSGWDLSLFVYDRDYFPNQRANNEDVMFCYGLFGERDGNYIQKPWRSARARRCCSRRSITDGHQGRGAGAHPRLHLHDALHHRPLHAAHGDRPSAHRARGLHQPGPDGTVRRGSGRRLLHHRDQRQHAAPRRIRADRPGQDPHRRLPVPL